MTIIRLILFNENCCNCSIKTTYILFKNILELNSTSGAQETEEKCGKTNFQRTRIWKTVVDLDL